MRPVLQIAFLTGQSRRGSSALSPLQERFLDALPVEGVRKVRLNFPYPASALVYVEPPLWRASWNNSVQFVGSYRAAFARRHRAAVESLLRDAPRTLLLAGSCGLGLLGNLGLSPGTLENVHVFAYGPVATRLPHCQVRSVQGRRDWISRAVSRQTDHRVGCGHLDYLDDGDVLRLCREYVQELLR